MWKRVEKNYQKILEIVKKSDGSPATLVSWYFNNPETKPLRSGITPLKKTVNCLKKYLRLRWDSWFGRKLHLCGFENSVLLEDVLLGLIMTERLCGEERIKRWEKKVLISQRTMTTQPVLEHVRVYVCLLPSSHRGTGKRWPQLTKRPLCWRS